MKKKVILNRFANRFGFIFHVWSSPTAASDNMKAKHSNRDSETLYTRSYENICFSILVAVYFNALYAYSIWLKYFQFVVKPYSINQSMECYRPAYRVIDNLSTRQLKVWMNFPFLTMISGPRPFLQGFIPFKDNISFNSFL